MALLDTSAESGLNKFLEEFIEKKNTIQDLKQFEILETENATSDNIVTTKNDAIPENCNKIIRTFNLTREL